MRKEVAEFIQRRDGYPRYICSILTIFPTYFEVKMKTRNVENAPFVSILLGKVIN